MMHMYNVPLMNVCGIYGTLGVIKINLYIHFMISVEFWYNICKYMCTYMNMHVPINKSSQVQLVFIAPNVLTYIICINIKRIGL